MTAVKRSNQPLLLGLGLAMGVLGGIALGHKLAAPRRMAYLSTWQQALAGKLGEVEAAMLAARVQARYDDLHARRPYFAHPALRAHLTGNILPGLALYQTLRAEGYSQEEALAEVERLFWLVFGRLSQAPSLLGRLPAPFALFRRIARTITRIGFPPPGWEMETVEDSDQALAFDVHRCFYLDMLTAYGAPELTALYCATDDWMAEGLLPAIHWERTQTLGRGDDHCDFCWRLVAPGQQS